MARAAISGSDDDATNNQPAPPVDGTATEQGNAVTVKLKGVAKPFTAEGPVLFPSEHMRRLIESARAGQSTVSAKVFDGSDDGRKIYDTFAVIGHRRPAPRQPPPQPGTSPCTRVCSPACRTGRYG